jgi:hypothetical protein
LRRPTTNPNDLKDLLQAAAVNLFKNQPNIYDFTSETGQTEWNLAHHLANEISKLLPWYDCDLDVTKRNIDNRRPDIIFHKRGINRRNFLVIELKRDGTPQELCDDIRKIQDDWFGERLSYRFGALINLKHRYESEIEVFENIRA